jgi:hypothetical protein
VQGIVTALLRDGHSGRRSVAKSIGLSARTLQRRLSQEGVTYARVVAQARLEIAQRMLDDPARRGRIPPRCQWHRHGEQTAHCRSRPGVRCPMTRYVIGLALCVLLANPLRAEDSAAPASGNEESNSDLAKKTQNPVADLISVPFQNNFNFNTGPEKRSVWDLNIQPVIPIKLTDDWNLITRTIVPIINQPPLAPGVDQATGLGDINPSFFLSPSGSKEFIWGLGPTFTFPTASNRLLGMGKYSMGPAAVALTMQGPWVAGALINNQWSFAGWGPTRVNALLLQPFVNYNFGEGWYS